MYKALISLIIILVMSASIGSGAPAGPERVIDEDIATQMPEKLVLAASTARAHQWQLVMADDGGEHCDL